MSGIPDASVQTCITSPPYWGLRDYGTATWVGGEVECSHVAVNTTRTAWANSIPGPAGDEGKNALYRNRTKEVGGECGKCGAKRTDLQLGLESTPEEYVEKLVAVFREVKRVLRDDGTLWLNLGDSYASQGGPEPSQTKWQVDGASNGQNGGKSRRPGNLKPKDLVGIPWMMAFALRADGWYLRSDIIWAKPNPMPESVTDRPTKAHEYVFLLSKSERYFYDAEAIMEPASVNKPWSQSSNGGAKAATERQGGGVLGVAADDAVGRNRRTVWTIPTHPFPEAHFATFPEKLVEPCVLAGCPEGGTVLDPFAGSGTVGVVAMKRARSFIGCELNPEYVRMARKRIGNTNPLFTKEAQ
jgi:DNA modification methylase